MAVASTAAPLVSCVKRHPMTWHLLNTVSSMLFCDVAHVEHSALAHYDAPRVFHQILVANTISLVRCQDMSQRAHLRLWLNMSQSCFDAKRQPATALVSRDGPRVLPYRPRRSPLKSPSTSAPNFAAKLCSISYRRPGSHSRSRSLFSSTQMYIVLVPRGPPLMVRKLE